MRNVVLLAFGAAFVLNSAGANAAVFMTHKSAMQQRHEAAQAHLDEVWKGRKFFVEINRQQAAQKKRFCPTCR